MIVGVDRPTLGRAMINGTPYAGQRAPLHEVGALPEVRSVHPVRTSLRGRAPPCWSPG